jgi:hypothetical protein
MVGHHLKFLFLRKPFMLRKNSIKVFDHIFPHKFTLKCLGENSLTPCIQSVSDIRVLISIRSRGCEMKGFFL